MKNYRKPPQPLEKTKQEYGFNSNILRLLTEFWIDNYNWKEREIFLNSYPQYITQIQGLKLHYLHVKPENAHNKIIKPLLLLHGWPGSVREFYEMIPYLVKPKSNTNFVFEVIAPSLPGFGFSSGSAKPGLGTAEISLVLKNLMKRLNFDKFYVQGGDWGAVIAAEMGILFPENVLGIHSNMCFVNNLKSTLKMFLGSLKTSFVVDKEHEHLMYPLSKIYSNLLLESGYMHIQSTKPDTIGKFVIFIHCFLRIFFLFLVPFFIILPMRVFFTQGFEFFFLFSITYFSFICLMVYVIKFKNKIEQFRNFCLRYCINRFSSWISCLHPRKIFYVDRTCI